MVFFANGLTKADPYAQAVALYGLAAFLELLAEPFYIRAQRRSKFKLRLVTETIATLSRSFVTFVLVTRPTTGSRFLSLSLSVSSHTVHVSG